MLQIVATIGPASLDLGPALAEAGASAFRLNASHMAPDELLTLSAALRRSVPEMLLIVDLQGAKMRLGLFNDLQVRKGERICFSSCGASGAVPLSHPELFSSVEPGETLGCDDDRLHFRIEALTPETAETTALVGGVLRARKGVNILEHPVRLTDLTEADAVAIGLTAKLRPVSFAFSFMADGRESEWIRRRAPGCEVIGKIERSEAARSIAAIAGAVDGLWICRGDLGAQLGQAAMARWVSALEPRNLPRPTVMAGQVLEHLTCHATPTRSETCHLFDLVGRGYAGFVLSDETAIGTDPVNAVRTLKSLLDSFLLQA